MASIVCRHRNQTLFERLSDGREFISFVVDSVEGKNVVREVRVDTSRLHSKLDRDDGKVKMYWYKARNNKVLTPQRVVKDAVINDFTFISLCGHFCSEVDYVKTKEFIDVTEMLSDIASQQPQSGRYSAIPTGPITNNILRFDEIPSETIFSEILGRDFSYGFYYQRVSKYHKGSLYSSNTTEDKMRGTYCPLVDEGFYENINFYEEDKIWYNPSKKFVQINHAVTKENFFDTDGFLCSIENYVHVPKERIEKYQKMFLFLI